jgi:anaerobic magnesium-protoporphyrin IX monomethyl ester cyclase
MKIAEDKNLIILAYPKIDHEKDYVYFWMPFSILTLAKVIQDETGYEVAIFDGNQKTVADWQNLLAKNASRLLFVGVSLMTGGGQIKHGLKMIELVKAITDAPVVVGGPHANVLPEQTVDHPLIDVVLTGPGQTSIPKYLEHLRGEIGQDKVPGLIVKEGSTYIRGPKNYPRSEELGSYPWQLIDVEQYVRNDPTVGSRTLNYVSSQGCVYLCQFCYELTYQRKWSAQPARSLVADIKEMVQKFKVNGIKFYDADWFINLKRSEAFCDAIIEGGISLKWAASINPNDVLKARERHPNLIRKLAKSGCTRLLMGVESGSDRVLEKVVKKEITVDQILSVASEIAEAGIMGSYTFIVGFPGETDSEVEETYQLLERLRTLRPQPETRVHLFAPYPGTPLYDAAITMGFEPPGRLEDWSNFDYYESQTPWTSTKTVERARGSTHMLLRPMEVKTQ